MKTPLKDIFLFFGTIALMALLAGCLSNDTHHASFAGMYATQSGTLAIGEVEIQSAPQGTESAMVSYEDDTSWFSDAKKHKIRILLAGTNSVTASPAIVSNICWAFVRAAPLLENGYPQISVSTNRTEVAKP